ncbi:MAG: 16S ribosomal RNA methyltransferase RsmE [Osedax symbiont Rs2]|nr:MAG: 16S ribosomal RNA methyltransferase RsmE [Osedax symbiont Rs2]
MNLILVSPSDFISTDEVFLSDRRFLHIQQIHRAQLGQRLKVGLLDGSSGYGEISAIDDQGVKLQLSLTQKALPALPLTLLLALPRPKMLKRILQSTAALGVKEIYLINSYKVDKSYWSTPVLDPECVHQQLLLGLEQSGDTILPKVHLRKRFKPFVEDELDAIAADSQKWLAHPYQACACPASSNLKSTLAIGPEGGFIEYEVAKLQEAGFNSISLGQRILRVETAIPVAVAKLCNF